MAAKQILYGEDARQKMKKGIETLAKTVKTTLGATGTISWTWVPGVVIPAGASRSLIFSAQYPSVAGTYNNLATAVTNEGSLEAAPVEVAVGQPRLTIAKDANSGRNEPRQPADP